jgi:methionyl-tRNA formyltransferase
MRILGISGTHLRHLYYFNKIHSEFNLSGMILEGRENILPDPPSDTSDHDRKNFEKHFRLRDEAEKYYFKNSAVPQCPILELDQGRLNSTEAIDFIEKVKPDIVLIYGSEMIRDPLFSALPRYTINLHGGLSPRYRGAATLFWPFYFMEPTYAGCTFHFITFEPDAGSIIHQATPQLGTKDGIHDIGCKAVITASEDVLKLLEIFLAKAGWNTFKQKSSGKNFLGKDFKPEHLRVNYDLFNDKMVAHYLEGKLRSEKPNLIKQF